MLLNLEFLDGFRAYISRRIYKSSGSEINNVEA